MFELDVTHLIDLDCSQFSDSIHNSGLENIGQVTWRNAVAHVAELEADGAPLVAPEHQDELRDWIRSTGGWDADEIAAMSDTETSALLLQYIAGDIKEMESFGDYEAYQQACEDGQCSGSLWRATDADGPEPGALTDRWFYTVDA